MSRPADSLIQKLRDIGTEVEFVKEDDLGPHYVQRVDTSDAGIWFYVDEVNIRVVVESIGSSP